MGPEHKPVSFQYVKPTDEVVAIMQTYRDMYENLAREIEKLPAGRGRALALTNLEQSAFWLNKGLTNND